MTSKAKSVSHICINTKYTKNKAKHISSPELTDDEIPVQEEPKPHSTRPQKKRCYNSIAESGGSGDCISSGPSNSANFGNDIQSMLNNIGTDFGKSRHAKRQRLEQYTTGTDIIVHIRSYDSEKELSNKSWIYLYI
mgnify:CR=1 FL=1